MIDEPWAVPYAAPPGERAQLLAARLAEQRFALSDEQRACWPFACAADLPAELSAAGLHWRNDALQTALQAAVEKLAERYFDLPPAERRAQWTELNAAAQYAPELQPRLQHLATGLDVDPEKLQAIDVLVQALLDELRQTYPLIPSARAAYRVELARDKRNGMTDWAGAATAALRRVHDQPDLGRSYLMRLESQPDRSRRITRLVRSLDSRFRVRARWQARTLADRVILGLLGLTTLLTIGVALASVLRDRPAVIRSKAYVGFGTPASVLEEIRREQERDMARLARLPIVLVVARTRFDELAAAGRMPDGTRYGEVPQFGVLLGGQVNGCPLPALVEPYETAEGVILILSDAAYAEFQACLARRGEGR